MFVAKRNTAKPFYVVFDGVAGLSIMSKLSKNGGVSNTVSPTISDLGGGLYAITPITSHRDTLGHQAWTFSASGQSDRWYAEQVVEYDPETAAVGALTSLGTHPPADWLDAQAIAANAITNSKIADNSITAAKIATDAITAAKLAADAIAEIQSGLSTLTQADIRTALGMAAANLDSRLDTVGTLLLDVPTVAEFNARTLPSASYFDPTTDTVIVGHMNDDVITIDAIAPSTLHGSQIHSTFGLTLANYILLSFQSALGFNINKIANEDNATTNKAAVIDAVPTVLEIDTQLSSTHGDDSWEGGSGAASIVIAPGVLQQERRDDYQLHIDCYVGETIEVSRFVFDSNDPPEPVNLAGKNLQFVIETKSKLNVATVDAIDVFGSDNNGFRFDLPIAATSEARLLECSLRDLNDGKRVWGRGLINVRYAPLSQD